MKIHKVYLLRNKHNDIMYVGLTSGPLKLRFDAHCLDKKLNKHEWKIELVQDNLTKLEGAALERMLIAQYDLVNTGLNKSHGTIDGCVVIHTQKTKDYLSAINKNKKVSEEHAAKNRIARLGAKNGSKWLEAQFKCHAKPVICITTNTYYRSISLAAKDLDLHGAKISDVCKGKRKSTGKYKFRYAEPVEIARNEQSAGT